ncbi:hypothetical protein [Streptomyces sp. NPDC059753]|uniref:hypothetical protein n=1 Tax=Streptomyces sp. NPDC059753 TaxID=3346933 RepID=UPI00364CBC32
MDGIRMVFARIEGDVVEVLLEDLGRDLGGREFTALRRPLDEGPVVGDVDGDRGDPGVQLLPLPEVPADAEVVAHAEGALEPGEEVLAALAEPAARYVRLDQRSWGYVSPSSSARVPWPCLTGSGPAGPCAAVYFGLKPRDREGGKGRYWQYTLHR